MILDNMVPSLIGQAYRCAIALCVNITETTSIYISNSSFVRAEGANILF